MADFQNVGNFDAGVFTPKLGGVAPSGSSFTIIENAGLMGLPIPAAITKAVDILKQRSETEQKG